MSTLQTPVRFMKELAEYLASAPSEEDLLAYRPSEAAQERARELLAKQNAGESTREEQRELDQFQHAEILMRLVKARIHAKKAKYP